MRKNRSERETRQLVADAVVEHVVVHGIGVVPELPMEQIIARAGVSRASAYRIWGNRADFTDFALHELVRGYDISTLTGEQVRAIAMQIEVAGGSRLDRAARFIAHSADAEFSVLLQSSRWQAFLGLEALATASPSGDLRAQILEANRRHVDRLHLFYAAVASLFGLRPIDAAGIATLAHGAMLLARGTATEVAQGGDADALRSIYVAALESLVRGTFAVEGEIDVPSTWLDLLIAAMSPLEHAS